MITSRIMVDLPSAVTERAVSPLERLGALFGKKPDLQTGTESLTVTAVAVLDGVVAALGSVNINNAVSLIVDETMIFIDLDDRDNDAGVMRRTAEKSEAFGADFEEMHIVFDHKQPGLHTLIDVCVKSKVSVGKEEMQITLSSRLSDLFAGNESSFQYSSRVGKFMRQKGGLTGFASVQSSLTERIASALSSRLPGIKARCIPPAIKLMQPTEAQLAGLRYVLFGPAVTPPSYRPVPLHRRTGKLADAYYYYYYDPYFELLSWILVRNMIKNQLWTDLDIYVTDPGGQLLFAARDATSVAWAHLDAIRFSKQNDAVSVAQSVVDLGKPNPIALFGPSAWDTRDNDGTGSALVHQSLARSSSDLSVTMSTEDDVDVDVDERISSVPAAPGRFNG